MILLSCIIIICYSKFVCYLIAFLSNSKKSLFTAFYHVKSLSKMRNLQLNDYIKHVFVEMRGRNENR